MLKIGCSLCVTLFLKMKIMYVLQFIFNWLLSNWIKEYMLKKKNAGFINVYNDSYMHTHEAHIKKFYCLNIKSKCIYFTILYSIFNARIYSNITFMLHILIHHQTLYIITHETRFWYTSIIFLKTCYM